MRYTIKDLDDMIDQSLNPLPQQRRIGDTLNIFRRHRATSASNAVLSQDPLSPVGKPSVFDDAKKL